MINTPNKTAECITRWGTASSVALLDPACQIYTGSAVPGIIGYKLQANNVIAFGDPLCEPTDMHVLMSEFHDHFESRSQNIIYVATSEAFAFKSLEIHCEALIGIGHEIILDPTHDPRSDNGKDASHLRGKCNQATRHDVVVHEYLESDTALEQAMDKLGETWVKDRAGPQIYLHHVDVFAHREHKRYFYAEQHGKLVGLLILNRMNARSGWVLSLSLIDRASPKGTSELLLVSTLDILRNENCQYLTIGTVPVPKIQTIEGLGLLKTCGIRASYGLAKCFFNLNHRHSYWTKFHPQSEKTYLVLSKPKLGLGGVLGIISALNASSK